MLVNSGHNHLLLFTINTLICLGFHSLNHLRKSSIESATTCKAMPAAHSKSSHSWRDLNSIPFIYMRLLFISFRVRCHEGVNLINAMRLWGATPSMATLPAVNGFDCQPLKPEGRVLCRESQNRFCFGRGINSGG